MWSLSSQFLVSFFGGCHPLPAKATVHFEALVCQCLGVAKDFSLLAREAGRTPRLPFSGVGKLHCALNLKVGTSVRL